MRRVIFYCIPQPQVINTIYYLLIIDSLHILMLNKVLLELSIQDKKE